MKEKEVFRKEEKPKEDVKEQSHSNGESSFIKKLLGFNEQVLDMIEDITKRYWLSQKLFFISLFTLCSIDLVIIGISIVVKNFDKMDYFRGVLGAISLSIHIFIIPRLFLTLKENKEGKQRFLSSYNTTVFVLCLSCFTLLVQVGIIIGNVISEIIKNV